MVALVVVYHRREAKCELTVAWESMTPDEQASRKRTRRGVDFSWHPICEPERSQDRIHGSSARRPPIAGSTRDIVWSIDLQGTILSGNRAMPPHALEKTIGTSCFDHVADEYRDVLRTAIQQAIETRKSCSCQFAGLGPDGHASRYHCDVLPVRQDGKAVVLTLIVANVSAQEQLERALERAQACWCEILKSVPVAIGVGTIEGKVLYANDAILQLTGYSREEIQHIDLKDTYADPETRLRIIEKLRKDGCVRDCEVQLRNRDGTLYWAKLNTLPFSLGGQEALLTTMGDITELTEVRQQADTLLAAVEQSADGILVGDLNGKIVYANQAFTKMHGYGPEEVLGMPAAELHAHEVKDEHLRRVRQMKERGSWKGEIGHSRKDGTVFPAYVSATVLKDSEGEDVGIVAVIRDITKAKQREKELDAYRAKMVQLEQCASLGTCSAMLSHQLNEPLTVVRLALEYSLESLQTTSCPDAVTEQLDAALRGVSKITSLATQFRRFARQGVPRTSSKVDLNAVANHIVHLFQELAQQARTALHLQGFGTLAPVYLKGDIEQLFFVLMENAIQAADGKHHHEVTISGAVRDEHIELRFTDDCGGIAAEDQKRLFEPFFTTKPARLGTGLGLCVAKRIVSEDGGDIRVESKPGEGSTFVVSLPINVTMRE